MSNAVGSMTSAQMREMFKLPKLPGNNFHDEMSKKNYGKTSIRALDAAKLNPKRPPPAANLVGEIQTSDENPDTAAPRQPRTLALDRKVLRFSGYFREAVHESPNEADRVRRCTVNYFLEDDTMSVTEPKEDNSGMPQGCMLKRHQVPKADGSMYTYEDLNVGVDLRVYGKCFHLCDCDAFTHKFLTGLGLEVPEGEQYPQDKHMKKKTEPTHSNRGPEDRHLKSVMESVFSGKRSRMAPHELAASKKFLQNDRKVLKFQARWDDRNALYGDDRTFSLYYFLADDSIEVTENLPVNAGRDPFPSFVRRQRCARPNAETGRFVNPRAELNFKGRKGEDDLENYYDEHDLYIGAEVNIFGRVFTIFDADVFTKGYLKNVLGHEEEPIVVKEPEKTKDKPVAPPYNGFGDEDDSLGNWKNLVLKAPKKNVRQYIENAGCMLKFSMRIKDADPANEVRRFVLTYYLADDTVSIFEPPQRNSGIIGGKFYSRQKARKPESGDPYRAKDFYVGAELTINRHRFVIFSTDEKSLSFMEANSGEFDHSNINKIMTKLKCMMLSSQTNLEAEMARVDKDGSGGLDNKEFYQLFVNLNLPISQQEVLTVLRFLDVNLDGQLTYKEVYSRILPEGGANTDARPWTQILSELERSAAWEKRVGDQGRKKADDRVSEVAAHAAKYFLDRYNERRVLFHNAFRSAADNSTDGRIGAPEFAKAVDVKLKLGFDARQLDALSAKLFPDKLPRTTYEEFLKIIQGTSLHPATTHSIANFKATN